MWYDPAAPAWCLHVTLEDEAGPVWRHVVVPTSIGLDDLHDVLSATMGWSGCDLYMFFFGGRDFGPAEMEDEPDESHHSLDGVAVAGDVFQWVYDLDEHHSHEVIIERAADAVDRTRLPLCTAGAGIVDVLTGLGHEEHGPRAFDLDETNRELEPFRTRARLGPAWEALDRLKRQDGDVFPRDPDAIVALGEEVVPFLIVLVRDGAPKSGVAIALLREIGLPTALAPVRAALRSFDPFEATYGRAVAAVAALGPGLAEPLIEDLGEAWRELERAPGTDTGWRDALLSVLARLRVRDDRVFAFLELLFADDAVAGACEFAEFGDPRGLPLLKERFAALRPDPADPEINDAIVEIGEAIEELGDTLSLDERQRVHRAAVLRNRRFLAREFGVPMAHPRSPIRAPERPGRNDPCWCGSGKKYKKCHQAADREQDVNGDGDGEDPERP